MQFRMDHFSVKTVAGLIWLSKARSFQAAIFLMLTAAFAAGQQNAAPPGGSLRIDKIDLPTPINQPPDANAQIMEHDKQGATPTYAAANAERRKQIAEDSARLMKLAADLKTEVEKTAKDKLSLNVIRKAGEIEKLAHAVKEKMKLSIGAN